MGGGSLRFSTRAYSSTRRASVEDVRAVEFPVRSNATPARKGDDRPKGSIINQAMAISKVTRHGIGLAFCQGVLSFAIGIIALVADWKYGFSIWYTDSGAGGKLRDMQYIFAIFNFMCALLGVKVYMAWTDSQNTNTSKKLFSSRLVVLGGYFTWAFGVWTTCVLFYSFKDFTLVGAHPMDLTLLFIAAAVCCLVSDTYCLGKLCSIGTYVSYLIEDTRTVSHDGVQLPQTQTFVPVTEIPETPDTPPPKSKSRRRRSPSPSSSSSSSESSESSDSDVEKGQKTPVQVKIESQPQPPQRSSFSNGGKGTPRDQARAAAIMQGSMMNSPGTQGGGVVLPHEFERLWDNLPTSGQFQASVAEWIPQERVVQHLTERGFQVVAGGTAGGSMKILFCARSPETGDTFLAEFGLDREVLRLSAVFKCQNAGLVPNFVKMFKLHRLFTVV